MCDTETLENWARGAMTRRQMGALGAAGALGACAPMASEPARSSEGSGLVERMVEFATPDGTLDGEYYFREGTRSPGVVFWPDIAGIRAAKRQMARRLAEAGYAVLLANPYYRDVKGQQFARTSQISPAMAASTRSSPWRDQAFGGDAHMRDDKGRSRLARHARWGRCEGAAWARRAIV